MKKFAFIILLSIGLLFFIKPEVINAQTACQYTPPTGAGTVTLSVTVQGGTYRVWSRMLVPDSTNNSFFIKFNSDCPIKVGDSSSIPSNTWTWVDYKDGNTGSKIDVTLPPGDHVLTLIGNEDGVGVDKVLMTQNPTCVPTGMSGDNCPAEVTDVNAPVITNISAYDITATSAKITWTLDEYASGQVDYRVVGSSTWQQTGFQTCCTYNYHIQTLSNLTSGANYEYRVKSTDASGNESISGICTFTAGGASPVACSSSAPSPTATNTPTSAPSPTNSPTSTPVPTTSPTDTTPPVISNPRVEEVTATTAKFRWELDEFASGQVEYRPLGASTWTKTGLQTCCTYDYHIQFVSGLTNGTTYEYRITSADQAGNSTTSSICRFTAGGSATQACGTSTPSSTPTPSKTPTPAPTATNTPSPTTAPNATVLRFQSVKLHGIGKGGDNTSPNSTGTLNPLRTTRQVSVELIDGSGNSLPIVTGNITYRGEVAGDFAGDVTLPESVSTGTYLIKIKSPQYLKKQVIGIINVTKGTVTNIPTISLTTGDIDDNNALTIADYNVLTDCYSDLLPAKTALIQPRKHQQISRMTEM